MTTTYDPPRLAPRARQHERLAAIVIFLGDPARASIGATSAEIHSAIGGSLKAVYDGLDKLAGYDLAERPNGRRSGAFRLTSAGRALVQLHEEAPAAAQEPASAFPQLVPALTSPEAPTGRRKAQDATSRFWGVYRDSGLARWRAQIGIGGAVVKLGNFPDEADAARVYDAASRLLGREEARCNFPGSADGLARKLAWRALASAGLLATISKAAA